MASEVSTQLASLVRGRAKSRCEYCLTSEALSGISCQIDHIRPRSLGGQTTEENLCLACIACNGHKQARVQSADPLSGEQVPLFNPRCQQWSDHFSWSSDGREVRGRTAIGRATVEALDLNNPLIAGARSLWASLAMHPPSGV